jgi:hypothetical protein
MLLNDANISADRKRINPDFGKHGNSSGAHCAGENPAQQDRLS